MMKILGLLTELLKRGRGFLSVPGFTGGVTTTVNPVPFHINNDPVCAGSFLFSVDSRESIVDGQKSEGEVDSPQSIVDSQKSNKKKNSPNINDELAQDAEQKRKNIPRWLVNDDLAAFSAVTGYLLQAMRKIFNFQTHHSSLITDHSSLSEKSPLNNGLVLRFTEM